MIVFLLDIGFNKHKCLRVKQQDKKPPNLIGNYKKKPSINSRQQIGQLMIGR